MQFLHQSWANLAEVDEGLMKQQEDNLVANLALHDDIDAQLH